MKRGGEGRERREGVREGVRERGGGRGEGGRVCE